MDGWVLGTQLWGGTEHWTRKEQITPGVIFRFSDSVPLLCRDHHWEPLAALPLTMTNPSPSLCCPPARTPGGGQAMVTGGARGSPTLTSTLFG